MSSASLIRDGSAQTSLVRVEWFPLPFSDIRDPQPLTTPPPQTVDGVAPYEEETWKEISFNPEHSGKGENSRFDVSCRTVRYDKPSYQILRLTLTLIPFSADSCKMPNVDQDSGARHPAEPDRSLRKFRDVDEGAKKKGCLGMQLTPLFDKTDVPEAMETWLKVGMSAEILKRGEHVYIAQ